MKRVFLIVLDSLGIGASYDAKKFHDEGANTLGHIAEACFQNKANDGRKGILNLPNMTALGIAKAVQLSTGQNLLGFNMDTKIIGAYGCASEISSGKDTQSGHWEIAGAPVLFDWDYFKNIKNSFPLTLLEKLLQKTNLPGYLGNCHASGPMIINQYGEEHIKTGKPIFYTSADSVFQVACHEHFFGLNQLYGICQIIHQELINSGYNIGRVIARPFLGETKENFNRTNNRRDFSITPPTPTVLEKLVNENHGEVIAIGKVADIYASQGITQVIKANGLDALFNATIKAIETTKRDNTIVFTNFVDFDSCWGHRRDIVGYARGLEFFDKRLPELLEIIQKNDMLIITADHGCDPSWPNNDHTRENVPILLYGPSVTPRSLGHRTTFSDIAQTIATYFSLSKMKYGKNMI